MLIEKNTSVKVAEKLSKNIDLEIEIERIWGRNLQGVTCAAGYQFTTTTTTTTTATATATATATTATTKDKPSVCMRL